MKGIRISITVTPQVSRAIDELLSQGLHGNNRADVADRLICNELIRLIRDGHLKVPREMARRV